jgi:hypothetical protein
MKRERTVKYSFSGVLIAAGISLSLLLMGSLYSTKSIFNSAHIRSVVYKSESKTNKVIGRDRNDLIVYKEETRYHNVFLPEVDLNEVPNQVLLDLVQGKISSYKFPKEKVTRVKIDFFYFPVKIHKEVQGFRVVYLNNKFYKQPFVKRIVSRSGFENWVVEVGWRILPFSAMAAIALFAPGFKKAVTSYLLLFLAVIWAAVSGLLSASLFPNHWLVGLFAVFIAFISIIWLSTAFYEQNFVEKCFSYQVADWFMDDEAEPTWIVILAVFGYGCAAIITWSFSFVKVVFCLKLYLLFLVGAGCLALISRLAYYYN